MIKRLNKATDQLDIIVCKDDMFARNVKRIIYYTQGHKDTFIEPEFEVQNDVIVIALPTQELDTLQAGILMRDTSVGSVIFFSLISDIILLFIKNKKQEE